MSHDIQMKRALELAARARGRTSPNPMVGAVIVKGGKVVGEGFHAKAGGPHAELVALKQAGAKAKGGTLYVNLEPCCHQGKTSPCTSALIKAGIREVVAGIRDPNPLVSGGGFAILREQGVKVTTPVLEDPCRRLNEVYLKFITTGLPFVILKFATTLDGKIATQAGESRWITGEAARARVHQLRDAVDAVAVGVNTIIIDNPRLTTRLESGVRGKDPIRIVIDSTLSIDLTANVLNLKSEAPTWIASLPTVDPKKVQAIKRRGADVIICKPDGQQRVNLEDLLCQLGARGVTSLVVEGGGAIHGSFLAKRLADKLLLFLAPKLMGEGGRSMISGFSAQSLTQTLHVRGLKVDRIGPDLVIEGYLT